MCTEGGLFWQLPREGRENSGHTNLAREYEWEAVIKCKGADKELCKRLVPS